VLKSPYFYHYEYITSRLSLYVGSFSDEVLRFKLQITLEEFIFPTPDDDYDDDDDDDYDDNDDDYDGDGGDDDHDNDDDDDDDDNGIIATKMAPFSCSSLPATPEFSPYQRCGILQAFFTSRLSLIRPSCQFKLRFN
jgi:hypothetical protein